MNKTKRLKPSRPEAMTAEVYLTLTAEVVEVPPRPCPNPVDLALMTRPVEHHIETTRGGRPLLH